MYSEQEQKHKNEIKTVFKEFCESTSLHGYSYLFIGKGPLYIWIPISEGGGANQNNCQETVWPSIIVCNKNQVEASFLKDIGVYSDVGLTNMLVKEFIEGHEEDFIPEQDEIIKNIKKYLGENSFLEWSRQKCKDLFISISFRGKNLTWEQLPQDWKDEGEFGPYNLNTDFGACCKFIPHFNFEPFDWTSSINAIEEFHQLKADARNGEAFGLNIVINTEQFNYGFRKAHGAGFKMSLLHHKDLAIMQFGSVLLHSGTETQMNVKPTVSYATNAAISTFTPEVRGCYAEGEVNMTYLHHSDGFRYQMNNCIINEGIRDIIWNCRCLPRFFYPCDFCGDDYLEYIPYCSGKGLLCANTRMKSMGSEIDEENNFIMPEALESPDVIGDILKPPPMNCIAACRLETNDIDMSFAPYPQQEVFFYQKAFCNTASHISQITCGNENRRYFIEKKQPQICKILNDFDEYFGKSSSCENWPDIFFEKYNEINTTLEDELYEYGRKNLAMVHLVMQSPYATLIKKDVAMTFTTYVANTGKYFLALL